MSLQSGVGVIVLVGVVVGVKVIVGVGVAGILMKNVTSSTADTSPSSSVDCACIR